MGRKKKQGNWNYIIIFLKTNQSSVQVPGAGMVWRRRGLRTREDRAGSSSKDTLNAVIKIRSVSSL